MNEAYIFADFCNKNFKKYKDIINIIDTNKDDNGISRISQSEIANKLNISSSLVSKCIRRLEISDRCIEKLKPGLYKINHTDLIKYGPQQKFLKYCAEILKDIKFVYLTIKERANILEMSEEEVKMLNGYWCEFIKELKNSDDEYE